MCFCQHVLSAEGWASGVWGPRGGRKELGREQGAVSGRPGWEQHRGCREKGLPGGIGPGKGRTHVSEGLSLRVRPVLPAAPGQPPAPAPHLRSRLLAHPSASAWAATCFPPHVPPTPATSYQGGRLPPCPRGQPCPVASQSASSQDKGGLQTAVLSWALLTLFRAEAGGRAGHTPRRFCPVQSCAGAGAPAPGPGARCSSQRAARGLEGRGRSLSSRARPPRRHRHTGLREGSTVQLGGGGY